MLKNVYFLTMLSKVIIIILMLISFLFTIGCTARYSTDSPNDRRFEIIDSQADSLRDHPGVQNENLISFLCEKPAFFILSKDLDVKPYNETNERYLDFRTEDRIDGSKKIVSGYRVQLFSGHDQRVAKVIEARLKVNYEQKVYSIYEAPLYKVRIGDFENRDNAARFCRQLVKNGFRNAWVVKSPISI